MPNVYSNAQLEAYLDELLPAKQAAAIEADLRNSDALKDQLTEINDRRDAGIHTLGEIWRRQRLSCPSRQQLGSYLLGVLDDDEADYVAFHVETIGCRYCTASIEDLRIQQEAEAEEDSKHRRQKYFQSSAGYLQPDV